MTGVGRPAIIWLLALAAGGSLRAQIPAHAPGGTLIGVVRLTGAQCVVLYREIASFLGESPVTPSPP